MLLRHHRCTLRCSPLGIILFVQYAPIIEQSNGKSSNIEKGINGESRSDGKLEVKETYNHKFAKSDRMVNGIYFDGHIS